MAGPGPSTRTPEDEQRASGHASAAQGMELSLIWPIQGRQRMQDDGALRQAGTHRLLAEARQIPLAAA